MSGFAPPQTAPQGAHRSLAWRLGFLYAVLFLIIGCYLPYLPVWLEWRGFTADQIAILLATPLFGRILIAPSISFVADRLGDRRFVLILTAWGALIAYGALWVAGGFWQMLLAMVLVALASTTLMPLTETIAISGIRRARLDYGQVRLWGSLSFIAASLGVGVVIQQLGAGLVLPFLMAAATLMIVGTYFIPRDLAATHRTRSATDGTPRLRLADAIALVRSPLFLLFLVAASLIHGSHAMLYAFGSLHWRAQGFTGGTIGMLWSIGVVAEILLFAVSGRIVGRIGSARLLVLAGFMTALRWSFMTFDPPLWATVILQTLHAMSFGAAHLAAIHFLTHAMPEDRSATAQGFFSAVVAGLVMGTATLVCGPLYENLGGEAYAVMAVVAAIGTIAAMLPRRRWDGGLVVGRANKEAYPQSPDAHPHNAGEGGKTLPSS
ncbi:MAG: MFS transporter [Methyloceanibacter sp.]|uniref:MFS transporter n=1 Tax=Methyloceanibacter sp. TaxID=1965321 RepID=UPI003C4CF88E